MKFPTILVHKPTLIFIPHSNNSCFEVSVVLLVIMITLFIENAFCDINKLRDYHGFFTELVTVSGDVVKASENENQELFWGMKGCGSNFG